MVLTPERENNWYIKTPGTKPLVIKSAIESNWTPSWLSTFNKRAKKPSKKSKKTPKKTKIKAALNWCEKVKKVAKQPHNKLDKVKRWGMAFLIINANKTRNYNFYNVELI